MTGKVAVYEVEYEVELPHFQVWLEEASTVNLAPAMFGIPTGIGRGQFIKQDIKQFVSYSTHR